MTSLSDLIPSSLSACVHITAVPPFIRRSVLVRIPSLSLNFPSYFLIPSPSPSLFFSLSSSPFFSEHAPVLSISPPGGRARARARAPFFPRHFIPSFSLHSLTRSPLPSLRRSPLSSLATRPLSSHTRRSLRAISSAIPLALAVSLRSFAHLLHNRARGCQPAPRNTL